MEEGEQGGRRTHASGSANAAGSTSGGQIADDDGRGVSRDGGAVKDVVIERGGQRGRGRVGGGREEGGESKGPSER